MTEFTYTTEIIGKLKNSISAEKLSTYESAAGTDTEDALRLYAWNAQMSAAFYIPLQGLEVTLRNALHNSLKGFFKRDDWYKAAPLDAFGKEQIKKAEETVRRKHAAESVSHTVAELSFGFWLSLLSKKYHMLLWVHCLHKAFHGTSLQRGDVHHDLNHLKTLRNRIAHHEPIFHRHLSNDYQSIINIMTLLCEDTSHWVAAHSNVTELLNQRLHSVKKVSEETSG